MRNVIRESLENLWAPFGSFAVYWQEEYIIDLATTTTTHKRRLNTAAINQKSVVDRPPVSVLYIVMRQQRGGGALCCSSYLLDLSVRWGFADAQHIVQLVVGHSSRMDEGCLSRGLEWTVFEARTTTWRRNPNERYVRVRSQNTQTKRIEQGRGGAEGERKMLFSQANRTTATINFLRFRRWSIGDGFTKYADNRCISLKSVSNQ